MLWGTSPKKRPPDKKERRVSLCSPTTPAPPPPSEALPTRKESGMERKRQGSNASHRMRRSSSVPRMQSRKRTGSTPTPDAPPCSPCESLASGIASPVFVERPPRSAAFMPPESTSPFTPGERMNDVNDRTNRGEHGARAKLEAFIDDKIRPDVKATRTTKSSSVPVPARVPRARSVPPGAPGGERGFHSVAVVHRLGSHENGKVEWQALLRQGISAMTSRVPGPASKGKAIRVGKPPRSGWFRAYHVEEFKRIRAFFGAKDSDVSARLGVDSPEYIVAVGGGGKSGAQMWFTPGKMFVIKSMTSSEARFFNSIAKDYCEHMTKQAESLLPKFYGVFGLWSPDQFSAGMHESALEFEPGDPRGWWPEPAAWLVVMQNIFDTPLEIHLKFDLKGSTVNRNVRTKPLQDADFVRRQRRQTVYKDCDLTGLGEHATATELAESEDRSACRKVRMGRLMKMILMQQLQVDTQFLQKHGIMDYSFLLGIHNVPEDQIEEKGSKKVRTLIPLKRGSAATVDAATVSKIKASLTTPEKKASVITQKNKSKSPYVSMFRRHHGGILSEVFRGPTAPRKGATAKGIVPANGQSPGKSADSEKRKQQVYFLGIIDCLQTYTAAKMAETGLKGIVHDWTKVSSVPPHMYASRFVKFIDSIIE